MRPEEKHSTVESGKSDQSVRAAPSSDELDLSKESISVRRNSEPKSALSPESKNYLEMLLKYASSYGKSGAAEALTLLGKSLDGLAYITPRLGLCMLAKASRSLALLEAAENEIIFRPTKPSSPGELRSSELASRINEYEFQTASGQGAYSWHIPASAGKPTMLLCLGNNQRLAEAEDALKIFTARGYGIFSFDYPGYGRSPGKPSQNGFYESAFAASEFMTENLGVPSPEKIIAGNSFGTTVAVETAAKVKEAKGLVLLSPLCSIPDAVRDRIKNLGVSGEIFDISDSIRQRFSAKDRIGEVSKPVVILHGTDDSVIPFYHAETLFDLAKAASARTLVSVRGAGHLDVLSRGSETVIAEMARLFG